MRPVSQQQRVQEKEAQTQLVSRIALQGSIGLALEKALEDIHHDPILAQQQVHQTQQQTQQQQSEQQQQQQHQQQSEQDESSSQQETIPCILSSTSIHSILTCFGQSVATTDWTTTAPVAILKGHLHHYNRFQGQWRIVVDTGAQLSLAMSSSMPSPLPARTWMSSPSRTTNHRSNNNNNIYNRNNGNNKAPSQTIPSNQTSTWNPHDKDKDANGDGKEHEVCHNTVVVFQDTVQILVFNDL